MGLNQTTSNKVYLSVADGFLVQTFKDAKAGTVERTTKTGKVVHELKYDSLDAYITSTSLRDTDYGKKRVFTFADTSDASLSYQLEVPASGRYATSLLKVIEQIDLSKPIRLKPWAMADSRDASKTIVGITLYQNGSKIVSKYTKENPNGLPEMVKKRVKGQDVWDDEEMMAFLDAKATAYFDANKSQVPQATGGSDSGLVAAETDMPDF